MSDALRFVTPIEIVLAVLLSRDNLITVPFVNPISLCVYIYETGMFRSYFNGCGRSVLSLSIVVISNRILYFPG